MRYILTAFILAGLVFAFFSGGKRKNGNILIASASAYSAPNLQPSQPDRVSVPVTPISTPVDSEELADVLKIDAFFLKLHKYARFNGAVLIARDGKILYKNGFGYANFKTKDTISTSTTFQLASVSKQFTAVAIMMLKEKGFLDFDDEVQKHIPEFPYPKITIRHLLTHRSGLANYMYFTSIMWNPWVDSSMSNSELLDLMVKHKPWPYRKPNRRYQYSNTGYALLANIVEEVSGVTFSQFVESHIFKRLEMNNSFVWTKDDSRVYPNKAFGYEPRRWRQKEFGTDYLDGVAGDKGVYSTVEDLYKWDQALYTDKLICQETLEEAFTPGCRDLRGSNYGFGWRLHKNDKKQRLVYHKGWWHGFNASFVRNIDEKTTVIILSNLINKTYACVNEIDDILGNPKTRKKKKELPEEPEEMLAVHR